MKYQDECWLRTQYIDNQRSICDMASECGVVKSTITTWMEKYGIDRRDVGETLHLKGSTEVNCAECGNSFRRQNHHTERDIDKHFCDNSCKGEYMSGRQARENNHNWRGVGDHSWRQSWEWRNIRKGCVERDNHKCQLCDKSKNLHVHHITPVHAGGDKYDPLNLVTLCQDCHMEVHSEALNY